MIAARNIQPSILKSLVTLVGLFTFRKEEQQVKAKGLHFTLPEVPGSEPCNFISFTVWGLSTSPLVDHRSTLKAIYRKGIKFCSSGSLIVSTTILPMFSADDGRHWTQSWHELPFLSSSSGSNTAWMGGHIVAPSRASMGSEPGIALRCLHHLKFEKAPVYRVLRTTGHRVDR